MTTPEKEPTTKYSRSINLDPQMAERLQRVCDHLGVTVNSYLKLKIGELVSRDEMTLIPKQAADQTNALVESFFRAATAQMLEGETQPGSEVHDQPK